LGSDILSEIQMLKLLNKLEWLIERYKLADSRKLLKNYINALTGNRKYSYFKETLKKFFKNVYGYFKFSFTFQEPYDLLDTDEVEELLYYIEHSEEIEKAIADRTIINKFRKWILKFKN
jgi:hypothetical protein